MYVHGDNTDWYTLYCTCIYRIMHVQYTMDDILVFIASMIVY